jgi:deoxyribonuclease-4
MSPRTRARTGAPAPVGAHVSAAGGVEKAPENAAAIGATAFALFVKNQRQWSAPPLPGDQAERFKEACARLGFEPGVILPHDGYLINLGSPDPEGLARSRAAFLDEMRRCEALGLTMLNFHPGSTLGRISEEECLLKVAESVNRALEATEGVAAVIENTAGQGGTVGRTFEQIALLVDAVHDKDRVGVCLDTCHLFASGYDLRTEEAFAAMLDDFDATVGLKYLRAFHVNDSKGALGSKLDRHQCLGEGQLGLEPFRLLMREPRLAKVPKILETTDPERWPEEIAMLRAFAESKGGKRGVGSGEP